MQQVLQLCIITLSGRVEDAHIYNHNTCVIGVAANE